MRVDLNNSKIQQNVNKIGPKIFYTQKILTTMKFLTKYLTTVMLCLILGQRSKTHVNYKTHFL